MPGFRLVLADKRINSADLHLVETQGPGKSQSQSPTGYNTQIDRRPYGSSTSFTAV